MVHLNCLSHQIRNLQGPGRVAQLVGVSFPLLQRLLVHHQLRCTREATNECINRWNKPNQLFLSLSFSLCVFLSLPPSPPHSFPPSLPLSL